MTNEGHRGRLKNVDDADPQTPAQRQTATPAQESVPPLPPVVARLVVEIRSDGSRTIARGALEDAVAGQDVAVAVEADSPAALLGKLTRSLVSLPGMLRSDRPALPEAPSERPSLRALGRRLRRRITRRR